MARIANTDLFRSEHGGTCCWRMTARKCERPRTPYVSKEASHDDDAAKARGLKWSSFLGQETGWAKKECRRFKMLPYLCAGTSILSTTLS